MDMFYEDVLIQPSSWEVAWDSIKYQYSWNNRFNEKLHDVYIVMSIREHEFNAMT